jgi:4'-phosphopantetheinyl transferase
VIDIYYCKIEQKNNWQLKDILKQLPKKLEKQVLNFKFQHTQYEHALGKLLLIKALTKYGYAPDSLKHIKYTRYSRPYIDDKIDFNISHSGEIVICGISSVQRLGVDIEKIRSIDFNNFVNVLNSSQWRKVYTSADPIRTFFYYWTQKESVTKAVGMGLSIPLEDIVIENDKAQLYQESFYIKELSVKPNYVAQLASNKAIDQVLYHKISFQ